MPKKGKPKKGAKKKAKRIVKKAKPKKKATTKPATTTMAMTPATEEMPPAIPTETHAPSTEWTSEPSESSQTQN